MTTTETAAMATEETVAIEVTEVTEATDVDMGHSTQTEWRLLLL